MDFFFWIREVFFSEGDFFYYFCRETQKEEKGRDSPPTDLGGSLEKADIYT